MMKKRFLISIIVAILATTIITPSTTYAKDNSSTDKWWESVGGSSSSYQYENGWPVRTFWDVSRNQWYFNYVGHCASKELLIGMDDGGFHPGDTLTRSQVAMTLFRMLGGISTSRYNTHQYADTPKDAWFHDAVYSTAGALGEDRINVTTWTDKYTGQVTGTVYDYRVYDAADRAHLVLMLSRYIDAAGLVYKGPNIKGVSNFSDISDLSSEIQEAIRGFAKVGLLSGRGGGRFDPHGALTRAEAAKMLDLFTDYYRPRNK